MRLPVPDEIQNYERWLWAALVRAHETYCNMKQPSASFIKVNSLFLEALAKEESEAKAATGE